MIKIVLIAATMAAVVTTAPIDNMKLRFKISARDLPDKDTIGTIDPYVIISYTEEGKKEESELGRSSTLTDQENPDWGDVFEIDFSRAKRQRLHLKVYDHDNGREDDKAGQAYVDVADFVDKNQHLNVNLNKKGYLILSSVDPVAPSAPTLQQTAPIVQGVQTIPIIQPVAPAAVLVPTAGGHVLVQQQHVIIPEKGKLKFKLSARDLPDKDKLGSTDPYVELYYTEGASTEEKKFARSATIDNNKNPQWGEVFEFDYDRSKQQKWLFKIYDHDQGREDDSAGKVWIDVNDYVQKGQTITANLSKKGTLTVTNANPQGTLATPAPVPAVVSPQQKSAVTPAPAPAVAPAAPIQVSNPLTRIKFRLSAKGLEDKDIIGTSDPHVKVYSKIGSEPEQLTGSTAKLTDTENPVWPDTIDFEYRPDEQPKLRFLVLDEDDGRRDDELGEVWLDVNEYVQKGQDQTLQLKKGTLNVRKA